MKRSLDCVTFSINFSRSAGAVVLVVLCVFLACSLSAIGAPGTTVTVEQIHGQPNSIVTVSGKSETPETTFSLAVTPAGIIQSPLGRDGEIVANTSNSIVMINTRLATKSYAVFAITSFGSIVQCDLNFADTVAGIFDTNQLDMPPAFQGLICTGVDGSTARFMLRWYDLEMRQDTFSLKHSEGNWIYIPGSYSSEKSIKHLY